MKAIDAYVFVCFLFCILALMESIIVNYSTKRRAAKAAREKRIVGSTAGLSAPRGTKADLQQTVMQLEVGVQSSAVIDERSG